MTIDRELLELAAKAAGIELHEKPFFTEESGLTQKQGSGIRCWNPLRKDGDAQRLAVKLAMCVSHWPRHSPPDVMVGYRKNEHEGSNWIEEYGDDPYAATRRAIVHAAAEIGRGMP